MLEKSLGYTVQPFNFVESALRFRQVESVAQSHIIYNWHIFTPGLLYSNLV